MGNARARGTYEERKAQAIAAGRIKHPTPPREPLIPGPIAADFLPALLGIFAAKKRATSAAAPVEATE